MVIKFGNKGEASSKKFEKLWFNLWSNVHDRLLYKAEKYQLPCSSYIALEWGDEFMPFSRALEQIVF